MKKDPQVMTGTGPETVTDYGAKREATLAKPAPGCISRILTRVHR